MNVTAIKTDRISPGSTSLIVLLDTVITEMTEGSILAISSKIVSICEGRAIPFDKADRESLIVQESERYLPETMSKYGHHFTITHGSLIASAGIDESNGNGNFILWPKDAQATANKVRGYLIDRFKLQKVGVIITDSTSIVLRAEQLEQCSPIVDLTRYMITRVNRIYLVAHSELSKPQ